LETATSSSLPVAPVDALPILKNVNITEAPERLQRKLYDALQLQVRYRPDQARFRPTLTDDTVEALAKVTGGSATREPETRVHATATPPRAPDQVMMSPS